jgi:hypothetical protein
MVTAAIRRSHALTEAEQRVVSVVMIRPGTEGALASGGGSLPAEVRRAAADAAGRIEHLADGSIAVAFGLRTLGRAQEALDTGEAALEGLIVEAR